MKLELESTDKIVTLNGIGVRLWEGRTASGIPVHCYIARVAVRGDQDCSQFDRELEQHRAPSPEVAAIPSRLIL